MSEIGHNSGVAGDELRQFIERIERVDEEIASMREDRKEIFAELKGRGYDAKTVRRILRLRKKDHSEIQEEKALLDLYASAVGLTALLD